jgi:hypothetical protein
MSDTSYTIKVRKAKRDAMALRHSTMLREMLLQHPAVKETFNLLPRAVRPDAWISGAGSHGFGVGIGLSLRDLSGFKDKALLRVLERFAGEEWAATTRDWPSTLNRDFIFKRTVPFTAEQQDAVTRHPSARWLAAHDADYAIPLRIEVTVQIYAYVKSDSETCRVVVKGVTERVIREEVKEFVCE